MKVMSAESSQERLPYVAVELPDWRSLNQRLRIVLTRMATSMEDVGSHMPTGRSFFDNKWLSTNRLHLDVEPAFQDIRIAIEKAANAVKARPHQSEPLCITSMWSIISRSGMEGRRHSHKGKVSAAYYVDAGDSSANVGGQLCFYAERHEPAPTHAIEPQSGLLVLFPSDLPHSVSRYASDCPRIVISANLQ